MAGTPKPTVYQFSNSHCSRKVRIAVAELNLPVQYVSVNLAVAENIEPWYVRLNSAAVVPTLVEPDGTVVTDSKRIVRLLAEKYGGMQTGLMPSDPAVRRLAETWADKQDTIEMAVLSFGSGRFAPPAIQKLRVQKKTRLCSVYAARFAATEPELAEIYRKKRTEATELDANVASPERHAAARNHTSALLGEMEQLLADGRTWLCGEDFTWADVLWAPLWSRLAEIGYLAGMVEGRPHVARYAKAVKARPSFQSAIVHFPSPVKSRVGLAKVTANLLYDRWLGGNEATVLAAAVVGAGAWYYAAAGAAVPRASL